MEMQHHLHRRVFEGERKIRYQYPEERSSRFLRHVGTYRPNHMASYPRRA
jgi:hypothetical protein